MSKISMKIATGVAVIGGIVAGAVSASAALNLPTMSCSYMFNTNMRIGSRGADVMNLQKVLNMYPQTQVSQSGAGSPGMETSTFGPATRAAVNRFQQLHLAELGITAPTGNVFAELVDFLTKYVQQWVIQVTLVIQETQVTLVL
jgi:peptidoglycan hydrolase-like protein with peptidoglycan-binding domain